MGVPAEHRCGLRNVAHVCWRLWQRGGAQEGEAPGAGRHRTRPQAVVAPRIAPQAGPAWQCSARTGWSAARARAFGPRQARWPTLRTEVHAPSVWPVPTGRAAAAAGSGTWVGEAGTCGKVVCKMWQRSVGHASARNLGSQPQSGKQAEASRPAGSSQRPLPVAFDRSRTQQRPAHRRPVKGPAHAAGAIVTRVHLEGGRAAVCGLNAQEHESAAGRAIGDDVVLTRCSVAGSGSRGRRHDAESASAAARQGQSAADAGRQQR